LFLYRRVGTALAALAGLVFVLGASCLAGDGVDMPRGTSEQEYRSMILKLQRDRDNIFAQVKKLTARQRDLIVAGDDLKRITEERDVLSTAVDRLRFRVNLQMEEIEVAKKEIAEALDSIEGLAEREDELKKKMEEIESEFGKSYAARKIQKLKKEKDEIAKAKRTAESNLKKAQSALATFEKKSGKENRALHGRLLELEKQMGEKDQKYEKNMAELQKAYAVAKELKERQEKYVRNLPQQFAELSRDKQRLVEDTANMHYNLGVFYSRKKDYRRALAEFQEAMNLKPDHALATYNVAHIYAAHYKNQEKAIEYFKKYLKDSPDAADRSEVLKYLATWEALVGEKEVQ